VRIKLRWSDFTTPTRQITLPHPTDQQPIIEDAATQLLRQLWQDQPTFDPGRVPTGATECASLPSIQRAARSMAPAPGPKT